MKQEHTSAPVSDNLLAYTLEVILVNRSWCCYSGLEDILIQIFVERDIRC